MSYSFNPGDIVEIHSIGIDLKEGVYITQIVDAFPSFNCPRLYRLKLSDEILDNFTNDFDKRWWSERGYFAEFPNYLSLHINKEINFIERDPEYNELFI